MCEIYLELFITIVYSSQVFNIAICHILVMSHLSFSMHWCLIITSSYTWLYAAYFSASIV